MSENFDNKEYQHYRALYIEKLFASGIDIIPTFGLLFVGGNYLLPISIWMLLSSSYIPFTIIGGVVLYRLITILLFKRTIGMFFCGLMYLNKDYKSLTAVERICASCMIPFHGIDIFSTKQD